MLALGVGSMATRDGCSSRCWAQHPYKRPGEELWTRAGMRNNSFQLEEGRVKWDIGMKLFTVRVVGHWDGMNGEALDAPSLFKARLEQPALVEGGPAHGAGGASRSFPTQPIP